MVKRTNADRRGGILGHILSGASLLMNAARFLYELFAG